MDIKQIQELVKLVNKSNIGELSIEKNDFKITIKQKNNLHNNLAPSTPGHQPQQVLPPPQITCGKCKKPGA